MKIFSWEQTRNLGMCLNQESTSNISMHQTTPSQLSYSSLAPRKSLKAQQLRVDGVKRTNKEMLKHPEFSKLGSRYHFRPKGYWRHGKCHPTKPWPWRNAAFHRNVGKAERSGEGFSKVFSQTPVCSQTQLQSSKDPGRVCGVSLLRHRIGRKAEWIWGVGTNGK